MPQDRKLRPVRYRSALADIPEACELSYDPKAEPVYDGLVHDYRMGEGIADRGPFAVRRIFLDEPLTDADFSPDFSQFTGKAADGSLHVVNLHVRRRIGSCRRATRAERALRRAVRVSTGSTRTGTSTSARA